MRAIRRISLVITLVFGTVAAAIGHIGLPAADAATGVQARMADEFVDSIGVASHLNYLGTPNGISTGLRDRLAELGVRHLRDGWGPGSQSVDAFANDLA